MSYAFATGAGTKDCRLPKAPRLVGLSAPFQLSEAPGKIGLRPERPLFAGRGCVHEGMKERVDACFVEVRRMKSCYRCNGLDVAAARLHHDLAPGQIGED
jgi:hypothetical protein